MSFVPYSDKNETHLVQSAIVDVRKTLDVTAEVSLQS